MKNTVIGQNNKTAYKFSVLAVCIFYALYFITVPILLSVSTNVQYMNTFMPQIINFIGKVFEVCGMAVIYALAVYSVYRSGKSAFGKAYLICGISAFMKCFFAQTVYWIGSGGIPAFNNGFFEELIWLVILPFALEMLQFTVFFLIANRRVMRFREGYDAASAAARAKGADYPQMDNWVYPFKKAFDLKNPLLYGSFVGGIVIAVSKLLLTALEEIDMAINGLAIKTVGDLALSVAGVMSDIACGVLAYTVMVFLIMKAFELSYAKRSK